MTDIVMRLTKRKLEAIQESLCARLAGELDGSDGDVPREDYEQALEWVRQKIAALNGERDD
jgi:hypothetical protein